VERAMGLMLMREVMNRKPGNSLIECALGLRTSCLAISAETLRGLLEQQFATNILNINT
jgi:hypothetical protein